MIAAPPPLKTLPQSASAASKPPQKGAVLSEEQMARAAFIRLKNKVVFRTSAIAVLAIFLALFLPFARPIHLYYAMTPENTVRRLTGLDMPNMTNRAVLSWATTSITEVMTMGFGDIDVRLPEQRGRFTQEGWDAYIETFEAMKIRETFKQSQLVLTTVPSNTPVIVGQDINPDNVYQWNVQMPIIMNYATNNNVTRRQRATVSLAIVRVPFEENSFGIAIQNWVLD